MFSLKDFLLPGFGLSHFLRLMGADSLKQAIRQMRFNGLKAALTFFSPNFDRDEARRILLKSDSAAGMLFLIHRVTWEGLYDFFSENDIDSFVKKLLQLLDRHSVVIGILEGIFGGDPGSIHNIPMSELEGRFKSHFEGLTLDGRRTFADRLIARRDAILDTVFLTAMRGQETHQRELIMVIDQTIALNNHRREEMTSLRWAVFYLDRIASQLERGEPALILKTLPDLLNAELPIVQRSALFDMLHRAVPAIDATEIIVNTIGSIVQQAKMSEFRGLVRESLDSFKPPAASQATSALVEFGGLGSSLNILNLLLRANADDAAEVIGQLHSQGGNTSPSMLAVIPTRMKGTLNGLMLNITTGDKYEVAILRVLRASLRERPESQRRQSQAEFLQLILRPGFEVLDSSIDGEEHDRFMQLLESV